VSSTALCVLVVFAPPRCRSRQPRHKRFRRPSNSCANVSAAFSGAVTWRRVGRRPQTLQLRLPGGSRWLQQRERTLTLSAARHALHQQDAQRLPTLTSAATLQEALQQQDEWTSVTRSQVRRAVTAANKRDRPAFVEEDRSRRRSIQKRLSATRPAAYPARLQLKREAQREARRPQVEVHRRERAQKAAQRADAVRVAQWAYTLGF
jgi:hypothetical protein